jgi:abortive infection bacteriophage resistance protein
VPKIGVHCAKKGSGCDLSVIDFLRAEYTLRLNNTPPASPLEAHMVGFSLSGTAILARIPFTKPALALQDQAILLASRGLVFENWAEAHDHLEHIGYYRFTRYLKPFKIGGNGPDQEKFHPNTTFELVHDRYIFDRKLRMLVLDAVEKIEIAVRAAISNSVSTRHGPHWFQNRAHFAKPNWFAQHRFSINVWHADFIDDMKRQIGHNQASRRDVFIKHYYDTYDAPDMPPCWMIFEAISFGTISQCFKFLKHPEYKEVCDKFGLNHQILGSWLHSVSYVRNICAHHSRFWNRVCTIKPTIPNAMRAEFATGNDRAYAALLVLQILLRRVWSNNHWAERLHALMQEHARVPLASMGFPLDWSARRPWELS